MGFVQGIGDFSLHDGYVRRNIRGRSLIGNDDQRPVQLMQNARDPPAHSPLSHDHDMVLPGHGRATLQELKLHG